MKTEELYPLVKVWLTITEQLSKFTTEAPNVKLNNIDVPLKIETYSPENMLLLIIELPVVCLLIPINPP